MPEHFRVVDTVERTFLTPAGRREKRYIVHIETAKGATGTVEIPASDWTEDKVPALVATKAAELDMAFALNEL